MRSVAAATVMGGMVYGLDKFFNGVWEEKGLVQELVALTVCISAGILVYFGCCELLRIREIRYLFRLAKR